MSKHSTMRTGPGRRRDNTTNKAQNDLRREFCDAYDFNPEQVGFRGESLDPIFDFDALSALSARLCNLPHVDVDFGAVQGQLGLATSRAYAVLPNGNTRKIFGSAIIGEVMHDGTQIRDIHQAVKVSRARALRIILRAVGFDPVAAHRSFNKTGNVLELQPPAKLTRDKERAEIHLLAQGLGLIFKDGESWDRQTYVHAISTFFNGKTSTTKLTDQEHSEFLAILRAWSRARAVIVDNAQRKVS